LGLRQAARRERRPLRVEAERLRLRQRRQLARALERHAGEALLHPDRAHLLRLPDEVRAAEGGDEVVGNRRRRRLLVLVRAEVDLDQLAPPLGGRVHDRRVDLAQRALRERRERADLLHLVAEELDAERLAAGGREDVDEPAADRELAAFLDALDALVAGVGEVLRDRVQSGLGAFLEGQRRRARRRRRQALRERSRGGAHETAR